MKKHFLKSLCLSALFMAFSCQLGAQNYKFPFPSQQTIAKLKNSTTYIVLEGGMGSEFDVQMKQNSKQYWTITPYKIIDMDQYERLCKNPNNSFLMVVSGQYTIFGKKIDVNLLTLVLGDKSGDINKMTDVMSVPLALLDEDGDSEEYGYKLGGIVRAMQYLLNNAPAEQDKGEHLKNLVHNNKNEIKNCKLLLTSEDLVKKEYSISQIETLYPYPFEIVEHDAIEQAVNRKDNACFCHIIGMQNYCLKAVIHCADGKILYYNTTKESPVGLLKSDFQNLK